MFKTNFNNYGRLMEKNGDSRGSYRAMSFFTRMLKEYSSDVFRKNVVTLAQIVSEAANAEQPVEVQAGSRICLGKDFAYKQMKIFAAVLLGSFVFKLDDKQKPVKYKTMLTLHLDRGLHLRAYNRFENT